MPVKTEKAREIVVPEPKVGRIEVDLLGRSPLLMNRLAEKARQELLLPSPPRRTRADKAQAIKHNPIEEFRNAIYLSSLGPTAIVAPASWITKSIASAALDVPGATKAEVSRLTWSQEEWIPIWGIPKLHMGVVRTADVNRTPDVRTRAIFPQWATRITICHVAQITEASLVNLLLMAGLTNGAGDWRPQKGGRFGQFDVVTDETREEFERIVASSTREAQLAAITHPEPYDDETRRLLEWWIEEMSRRGVEVPSLVGV
jgi:hypothetical protein